mgnify:CR=1 FL=1
MTMLETCGLPRITFLRKDISCNVGRAHRLHRTAISSIVNEVLPNYVSVLGDVQRRGQPKCHAHAPGAAAHNLS